MIMAIRRQNIFTNIIIFFILIGMSIASEDKLHNKLYQEISIKNANKNIIYSPISIQLCVALAHAGANGQTQNEISQVLGYGPQFSTKNMSSILDHLYAQNNALQIANKVYVNSGYTLKPNYNEIVTKDLKSAVESINFNENSKAAASINDWIETQTNHNIKDIIKPDMLGPDTLLLLLNAVYFKASWSVQFSKGQMEDFSNSDGSVVQTLLMHNEDDFKVGHFDNLAAHIVKMDYHNTNIAMYLIIPDETQGLQKIEQNLNQLNFKDVNSRLEQRYIKLLMPRFKFEFESSLNEVLKKLGMQTAFTDSADFSGMLDKSDERLKISDAIHKAFINVDEKGTEAGAATVIRIVRLSLRYPSLTLKADHPFMFAIVSEDYDVPLFMGAVKHL